MRNLIKLILSVGILSTLSVNEPAYSQKINLKRLSKKIETSFNTNNLSMLNDHIEQEIALDIEKKYLLFLKEFPNARWDISPAKELKGNKKSIELLITAKKKVGKQIYSLKTNQKLALDIKNGKIVSRELLSEHSILSTAKRPIDITLQIPDVVLTGSWYDVDIIINKPLKNSIIAGGLMPLKETNHTNLLKETIQLRPMGSGGIFKSVQAPLNPGEQRWAAIIAHPEGVVSITKLVKIVSTKEDFSF